MDRILKEFRLINNKVALCANYYEEVSLISYLAGLSEEEIITTEIETASSILHSALKNLYENYFSVMESIFNNDKSFVVLTEKSYGNEYKIFIKDKWLFQVILVNTVKHLDIMDDRSTPLIISVIAHIVRNFVIAKPLSLHLLKILSLIVTKRRDVLSPNLSLTILKHMNQVVVSPITVFRQTARGISKEVIPFLPEQERIFLDVSLLPIRGIDMCDIVKCFPETYIRENQNEIVKKVLDMFSKNVESKEGGALYECFLFYSFNDWKIEIWPLFLPHLKFMDYEGEFFQSFLKYWITTNVCAFKSKFYNYIRNEQLDWKIKAYVLLESKKRGYTTIDDSVIKDVLIIFQNAETRDLGLKIAVTYHKISLWPHNKEISIIMNYLYSNTKIALDEEETRCLNLFLSHIFLHGNNQLVKTDVNLQQYIEVIKSIYKYCSASLKTNFFEVGAEVLHLLWTIGTGSHKDMVLNYKLEKRDCYESGKNLLYCKLKENNMWWLAREQFYQELKSCFHRNNGCSTYLTKIFTKHLNHFDIFNTIDLKNVINDCLLQCSIDSERRLKNYAEIVLQNRHCDKDNSAFLDDVLTFLVHLNLPGSYSDKIIFKNVLYLEIILIAARSDQLDLQKLPAVIENCLSVIENIIVSRDSSGDINYNTLKILEAFINNVMTCIIENVDFLWNMIDKEKVISQLLVIIQKSNMKRPLSLSVEILKRFGSKMNENDCDKKLKIVLLSNTLKSLCQNITKSSLKIRRSPESRLVIHALCFSDKNPNRPLLKWALNSLLEIISDETSHDSALASALHSIEILVSDNSLQYPTLPLISNVIIQCVELFSRPSWIVRNANLQLVRAIIDRFYGVCLDVSNRPKCMEDLLVLFPILSSYFYGILSSENLDERATLVFQFFSESQIKRNIWSSELAETSRKSFLKLFFDILLKYPNHHGRLAAHSYSAVSTPKEVPNEICRVIYFLKSNYKFVCKNVYKNLIFLIELLYEKYRSSFEYSISKDEMKVIDYALKDLLNSLGDKDNGFYNFILFKVKPRDVVINEFRNHLNTDDFTQRIWLHNYVPFIIINTEAKEICYILNAILSQTLLSCIEIKILSILVSRFENNEFNSETCNEILKILFQKSFCVDDSNHYLLNCYFKTILVFYQARPYNNQKLLPLNNSRNVFKILINFLYYSELVNHLGSSDQQIFYSLVETVYVNFTSFEDDIRNDIISTLAYLQRGAPKEIKAKIFKIVFYSSLFTSTYREVYYCISIISGKNYSSILTAMKDFFSVEKLTENLRDKNLVIRFFSDIAQYIPEHSEKAQSDGYYSEESDILVPKLFLEKLIYREIRQL